ncbi:MAG: hypothetical protein JST83_05560 [Bacteroidetes bacterium]|nr:hypothetical protein [Bacteroidota bacterium]
MKIVLATALTLVVCACAAQTPSTSAKAPENAMAKPTAAKTDTLRIVDRTSTERVNPSRPATKASTRLTVVEYTEIDLDTANMPLPFLIKAPVGSAISFDQGVIVTAPDTTFSILIDMSYSEMPATIAQRKKDAQENQMFLLQKFIIDRPDVLLYEVKYEGKTEYHFEMAKDIRGTRYYLHDQWIPGHPFTQKQVEAMLKAAGEAHPRP